MANAKVTFVGPPGEDHVPKIIQTLGYEFHFNKPTLIPMHDVDALTRLRKNPAFEVIGDFKELDRETTETQRAISSRLAQDDDKLRAEREAQNAAAAAAQQQVVASAAADKRRTDEAKVAKLQAEQKAAAKLREQQTADALARQIGAPPKPAA